MTEQLSPFRIKQGRRIFDSYSAVNSFSFALVTGNTITLYAMAIGASGTVVGLLGAFMYLSFFAIPLGKAALRRGTLVRTFANSWMLRNWSLVPLLFIPYLAARGQNRAAIFILLLCVFLFNLFRGVGLIANNPVIGVLAPGKDRGEYIVRLSLINNGTALIATIGLAALLWMDSGVHTYNLVTLVGIITGIIASSLLYRLPDPGKPRDLPGSASSSFASRVKESFSQPNFRRFLLSYLIMGLGIGMARPFIIVYCKTVYGQTDSLVTVFTLCSSVGALAMGLVMRLAIDRLGSKPMYIIFSTVSLLSLIPALIAPGIGFGLFSLVFLCLFAAATNMGFAGQENAAQTYFFAMVPKESIMDLSMLYYFILGGTGALGSAFGGAFLDLLTGAGLPWLWAFRVFFLASVLLIWLGSLVQRKLQDMGSYPVKDTLAILFSPRDMRALTLLRRLDANEDPDEETEIIAELGEVKSRVSVSGLLDHLSSPRFAVRYEALQSVSSLDRLDSRIRDALLRELEEGAFSTAALAARFLGKFGVSQAVPKLREALKSPDYRLVGEAMLALARLKDGKGQFMVSDMLLTTANPFLLIRGVQAMEEYGTAASVPILLDLLRNEALPAHITDETILILSQLMGVPKRFFYLFEQYIGDHPAAPRILEEVYDEYSSRFHRTDGRLQRIVSDFIRDVNQDSAFVRWVLDYGSGRTGVYSALLVSVALDAGLNRQESFRFFLCYWALSVFANPALIEK
ncbi:MFS transporter [Treponema zuelzerae]|uniref:MFS transporter n=1 Tax=Teretinema zuelzerae TaxID=156 RepID=A0AAE3EIR7_9SPIR|nr:MFS transporter [Teretinema zuelzerae]MCD1655237.1 MFS transporter [Teretinema zuelzerae]